METKELCFIDVETTGALFGYHEIIEVAAIRTSPDAGDIKGVWHKRLKPKHPNYITTIAQELNGFTMEAWADEPYSCHATWKQFQDFAKGCVAVCHNPSFDRPFLSMTAADSGIMDLGLDYHWIGTESLGWPLYLHGQIEKPSLDEMCKLFGFPKEPIPHRALEGAKRCRDVYIRLVACLIVNSR